MGELTIREMEQDGDFAAWFSELIELEEGIGGLHRQRRRAVSHPQQRDRRLDRGPALLAARWGGPSGGRGRPAAGTAQGHAHRLLAAFEERAVEAGAHVAEFWTDDDRSEGLLAALGWESYLPAAGVPGPAPLVPHGEAVRDPPADPRTSLTRWRRTGPAALSWVAGPACIYDANCLARGAHGHHHRCLPRDRSQSRSAARTWRGRVRELMEAHERKRDVWCPSDLLEPEPDTDPDEHLAPSFGPRPTGSRTTSAPPSPSTS